MIVTFAFAFTTVFTGGLTSVFPSLGLGAATVIAVVVFDLGITLDGFIAGPNGGPKNPLGDGRNFAKIINDLNREYNAGTPILSEDIKPGN